MLSLIAMTALALGGVQEPAAVQADEAVAEVSAATARLAKAESYTFTTTSKTERPEGRGGGRGGARGGGGPVTTTGSFVQGLPMLLVTGDSMAYKQGDVLVHKNDAGSWEELDPQSLWGGGGRRGGGNPMNRTLFWMMRIHAPGEMLADFAEKQATIAHTEEGELDVFTGKLTREAAEGIGGGFGRRGRGAQAGGGMTVEGSYRVEVKAGQVVGASFEIERSGDFGGRSFEMTTQTTIALQKVGETEVEVPDEVKLLFSS